MRRLLMPLCALALMLCTGFISLDPGLPEGEMILVNKNHPLAKDYVPDDLVEAEIPFASGTPDERKKMAREAAQALEALFAAAQEDGITLYGVSGYRSYATQRRIYNRRLEETSQSYVDMYIARPGESEHQTGLAMDISDSDSRALTEDFADTDAYRWLLKKAAGYGFIIRYTKGGEEETGYGFEPWHIRYVGKAAESVAESGQPYEVWLEKRQILFYARERLPLTMR